MRTTAETHSCQTRLSDGGKNSGPLLLPKGENDDGAEGSPSKVGKLGPEGGPKLGSENEGTATAVMEQQTWVRQCHPTDKVLWKFDCSDFEKYIFQTLRFLKEYILPL